MQDWKLQTLLSQYANSPKLLALLQAFNDAVDPEALVDDFYTSIWDVATATGYGLDVWGRIVNVPRTFAVPVDSLWVGFSEQISGTGPQPQPLSQAPAYPGYTIAITTPYTLTDDDYRKLIMVKAMANISDCSAPSLNRMLMFLFGSRGQCYVQDLGGMAMRYVFKFALTAVERAIMNYSNAVPRPAGVSVSIVEI